MEPLETTIVYTYTTWVTFATPENFNIAGVSTVFWCDNDLTPGSRVRLTIERLPDANSGTILPDREGTP